MKLMLTLIESLDIPEPIRSHVIDGYSHIFESLSGTSGAMYSDGVGDIPSSDYFVGGFKQMSSYIPTTSLIDTNMDDSENWNGSEMDEFDLEESDLIDELKINDITHVTTPHDNNSTEVDLFQATDTYNSLIDKVDDLGKLNRFSTKQLGKKDGGVYHLTIDSSKFRKP